MIPDDWWLTLFGVTVAAVGVPVGLYQYYMAQKWKRAEFCAGEFKLFSSREEIKKAFLMLDPKIKTVKISKAFKDGFEPTDDNLVRALRIPEGDDQLSDQEAEIQVIFDHFFDGLELFNDYIDSKLIKTEDVDVYFYWWVDIMTTSGKSKRSEKFVCTIKRYLDYNEYDSVIEFFEKHKKSRYKLASNRSSYRFADIWKRGMP